MDLPWDTLVILDAARYDFFVLHHRLMAMRGEPEPHRSRGCNTFEFTARNFIDPPYHDTVYVSASPVLFSGQGLDEWPAVDDFHAIVIAWDGINKETEDVVMPFEPDKMTEVVAWAHNEYPAKRIIAHYMQPHTPFVGPLGQHFTKSDEYQDSIPHPDGPMSDEYPVKWRTAYFENLLIAMRQSKKLFDLVDGRVAVTSDHGELLCEPVDGSGGVIRGHHMSHSEDTRLRTVPWLEVDCGDRAIASEPRGEVVSMGEHHDGMDEAVQHARENLQALGYMPE